MWAIQDVKEETEQAELNFEQNMIKRELKEAEDKKFKFELFNIKDNEKLYKDFCWACDRGKKCLKHPPPEL